MEEQTYEPKDEEIIHRIKERKEIFDEITFNVKQVYILNSNDIFTEISGMALMDMSFIFIIDNLKA